MHFFYVKLPVGKHSALSEYAFHDGLEAALAAQQLGSVLGWGASLSEPEADMPGHVAFHRIDIEVAEPARARALLKSALVELGAPAGTELHYTADGAAWQDVYGPAGWDDRQPVALHQRPGS